MTTRPALTRNVDHLHTLVHELHDQIEVLQNHLLQMKRLAFGPKTEHVDLDQFSLFETYDVELVPVDEPDNFNHNSNTKHDESGERRAAIRVLAELTVTTDIIDLPEHEKDCACCGQRMTDIGEDVSKQIEYIPAQLQLKEIHRKKYACRECELDIKRAPAPFKPIPKSMASPSLLAYLICSKFTDHMPYHRLEKRLDRLGLTLSRKNMSDWCIRSAEVLEPVYQALKREVLSRGHVFTDDTILPMQNNDPRRNSTVKARAWVYATNDKRGPPIAVYDFSTGREQAAPHAFLETFEGYLQADGYPGYQALYKFKAIEEAACWVHARRRFFNASELLKTPGRAHEGLRWIKTLYRIEQHIKKLAPEARYRVRQEKSIPLLKAFHAWLVQQSTSVLPKSPLGDAIFYMLNRWDSFTRYCEAGELAMDNNLAERLMRPIALARKNYLFVGSEQAGHATARLYSIVETCKANKINPQAYFTYALSRPDPLSPLEWDRDKVPNLDL